VRQLAAALFSRELARAGALALTSPRGVSTMRKQENADQKVGATKAEHRASKLACAKAAASCRTPKRFNLQF